VAVAGRGERQAEQQEHELDLSTSGTAAGSAGAGNGKAGETSTSIKHYRASTGARVHMVAASAQIPTPRGRPARPSTQLLLS